MGAAGRKFKSSRSDVLLESFGFAQLAQKPINPRHVCISAVSIPGPSICMGAILVQVKNGPYPTRICGQSRKFESFLACSLFMPFGNYFKGRSPNRPPSLTHVFHLCSTICPDSSWHFTTAGSNPTVPIEVNVRVLVSSLSWRFIKGKAFSP